MFFVVKAKLVDLSFNIIELLPFPARLPFPVRMTSVVQWLVSDVHFIMLIYCQACVSRTVSLTWMYTTIILQCINFEIIFLYHVFCVSNVILFMCNFNLIKHEHSYSFQYFSYCVTLLLISHLKATLIVFLMSLLFEINCNSSRYLIEMYVAEHFIYK